MASNLSELERSLRRLRKKLRQIEHLENLDRDLNQEELAKVSAKEDIRKSLEEMKRRSEPSDAETTPKKTRPASSPPQPTTITPSQNCLNQEQQLEISLPETPRKNAESSSNGNARQVNNAQASTSGDQGTVQIKLATPAKKSAKKQSIKRDTWVQWKDRKTIVDVLEGHEDLSTACDVDVERDLAVTSSRDTTILVWRVSSAELVSSLRGHTGHVTSVKILPKEANARLGQKESAVLAISGSLDCALKLWDLKKGVMLKNIYTYNGIKCLGYCGPVNCAVTGTDGGKVEFFNLETALNVHSIKAHEDVVTAIDMDGVRMSSGARDGMIKLWEVTPKAVRCLYASENLEPAEEDQAAHFRCILSLKILSDNLIAYGDSGCNIKIINWKTGLLHKLPNHLTEVGFTDALSLAGSGDSRLLLSSSYDLDTGLGHVNMFHLSEAELPEYICSWTDEDSTRIFGLCCQRTGDGQVTFVSVGKECKVWRTIDARDLPEEDAVVVKPLQLSLLNTDVIDSGSSDDSEMSSTESDDERSVRSPSRRTRSRSRDSRQQESGWGCNIL